MILPSYKPNSLYNVNQRSQRTVENILSTNTGCIVDRISVVVFCLLNCFLVTSEMITLVQAQHGSHGCFYLWTKEKTILKK